MHLVMNGETNEQAPRPPQPHVQVFVDAGYYTTMTRLRGFAPLAYTDEDARDHRPLCDRPIEFCVSHVVPEALPDADKTGQDNLSWPRRFAVRGVLRSGTMDTVGIKLQRRRTPDRDTEQDNKEFTVLNIMDYPVCSALVLNAAPSLGDVLVPV